VMAKETEVQGSGKRLSELTNVHSQQPRIT
jgi:hypothetical protein